VSVKSKWCEENIDERTLDLVGWGFGFAVTCTFDFEVKVANNLSRGCSFHIIHIITDTHGTMFVIGSSSSAIYASCFRG